MDFETIEIFIVCYIGNQNMMSFSFKNTSLKRLTSYDLQNFCYELLNNMRVLKIQKVHSYLKLGFPKLFFKKEAQNRGVQQGMHLFLKNNIKKSMGFLVWLLLDLVKPFKYGIFILKVMNRFTLQLPFHIFPIIYGSIYESNVSMQLV